MPSLLLSSSASSARYALIAVVAIIIGSQQQQYLTTSAQVLDENGNCKLVALLPFTDEREGPPAEIANDGVDYYGYGDYPNQHGLEKNSFSLLATLELAVDHFNNRNPILVPELASKELQAGSCDIKFSDVVYKNSAFKRSKSIYAIENVTHTASLQGGEIEKSICAVIGPTDVKATETISAMTETYNIPHITYNQIDVQFTNRKNFPTLLRFIPSSREFSYIIANYLQRDVLQRDYVAVSYFSSDFGEMFEYPLEDAGEYLDFAVIAKGFFEEDLDSIAASLDTIVEQGFHTIILASNRLAVLDDVAKIAEEKGLLGNEYIWLLSGDMLTPIQLSNLKYPEDSPTDKLLRGAAIFTNYDPFMYQENAEEEKDPFLKEWELQDDYFMERVRKLHPLGEEALYSGEFNYFQENTPALYSSFLYDSIIATGISACKAAASKKEETSSHTNTNNHVEQLLEIDFHGASGHVRFGKENIDGTEERINGRDSSGVKFGMYNVRPGNVDSDGMRSYDVVLTHVYTNETQVEDARIPVMGSWRRIKGSSNGGNNEEIVEFFYFDGTPNVPTTLKTVEGSNYISKPIQIVGLFITVLGLLIAIGTGTWVYVMRKTRLVTASQPEFLYLLCFGSALISMSLFFISYDEDKGLSEDTLSSFCSTFPWLFVLGYNIMYCALYFKLWRLNKLLSMRRQIVKINKVYLPFATVITCSIIVLVFWQIFNPLVWERRVISGEENPADPLITYGECNSIDGSVLPYVCLLGFIIGATVIMTGLMSWQLKDVQSDLSESKWIFFGIFSHVQIWALGIPLYIILDGTSRHASYVISVALVFILSSSMVMLVIWPKIYTWIRDKWFGGPPTNNVSIAIRPTAEGRTRVSGLDLPGNSFAPGDNTGHNFDDSFNNNTMSFRMPKPYESKEMKEKNANLEREMKELKSKHQKEKAELMNLITSLQKMQQQPRNGTGITERGSDNSNMELDLERSSMLENFTDEDQKAEF